MNNPDFIAKGYKNMEASSNHIGLISKDAVNLIVFYTDVLGFEKGETRDLPKELMFRIFGIPVEGKMTKIHLGQVVLEIFTTIDFDLMSRSPVIDGYNHWGLMVSDKQAYLDEVEKKGAQIIKIDYKDRVLTFIKDPDNNLIEVFESK